MPKAKSTEKWREWTAEEAARYPRRVCSVAGCKSQPVSVKETKLRRDGDGAPTLRRHVYCGEHTPVTQPA